MKKTLITFIGEHIGQMQEADADAEVKRMNDQTNSTDWHKDYSDQMYCLDETDYHVSNPCVRGKGYCFVTSSTTVENWKGDLSKF